MGGSSGIETIIYRPEAVTVRFVQYASLLDDETSDDTALHIFVNLRLSRIQSRQLYLTGAFPFLKQAELASLPKQRLDCLWNR